MNKQIEQLVQDLNTRLGRPTTYLTADGEGGYAQCSIGHLHADLNTFYGGYRLNETTNSGGGCSGFAHNSGTEARMTCKEFKLYLRGIHDAIDAFTDRQLIS